ncbi:MAG: RidA family protein [Dehalococcoidia bacterium]|nr:RidA family protein [Dehalococcoidia bacterium]
MQREIITPPNVHKATGYSHAVRVGSTVYVAGQVALDIEGRLVGPGDFAAQAEQAYRNLQAVLAAAGSSLGHIVKLTTYLTRAQDIPRYREARARFLASDPPASTLVVIAALALPELLVEIEAIAIVAE